MHAEETQLRPATPDDAVALAELVNMAGEGLPLYLWANLAEPGEDAWAVGRRRARRESGGFSWRNATLLTAAAEVAAGLVGYPLPALPEPIPDDMPAMFVPLQELENLAPGAWYVNVLATYPAFRGRGYGARLLAHAEEVAAGAGCGALAIIVADANRDARRLYQRCGHRETARRKAVKEGWVNAVEDWVLLVKELG